MKIAVLTDSSCGYEIKEKHNDLHIIPLMITKENGEQVKDDENLTSDKFYSLLDEQILKTSQTVPGDMMNKWDELLKEYDQIVVALLSKGLSGQYNTAQMLSQEPEYKDKIFVVDTNGVSIILENIVDEIFNKVNEGKDGPTILKEIEEMNSSFVCYIIPNNLDRLVKGGRISKAAAAMANLFKITPILKYDGVIDKETKTRTFKKAINESLDLIKSKTDDIKYIDISYSKSTDEILQLVIDQIEAQGLKVRLNRQLSNVITCHTGRETFALATWMK